MYLVKMLVEVVDDAIFDRSILEDFGGDDSVWRTSVNHLTRIVTHERNSEAENKNEKCLQCLFS